VEGLVTGWTMKFVSLAGSDAKFIELDIHSDTRGRFARTWCSELFEKAGIDFNPVQANTSLTRTKGAVRGMHFQRPPHADAKIVRCSLGRIHDVIVDLRQGSPTAGCVIETLLDGGEGATMLYVPPGFAHGFQTLSDNVVVEYLMGAPYVASLYDGVRYDDPLLAITWPEPVTEISDNDLRWPDLAERMPWLRQKVAS
jgi:dTDP-4-dehydrorhamnose 3,5-epimerase